MKPIGVLSQDCMAPSCQRMLSLEFRIVIWRIAIVTINDESTSFNSFVNKTRALCFQHSKHNEHSAYCNDITSLKPNKIYKIAITLNRNYEKQNNV